MIGLSIAWRAAQQGQRVVLADPQPGLGATHAAAGMLTPIAEAAYAEREIFGLGQDSLRRYPDFIAELQAVTGLPTGFRQVGTLQVAYDSDDLALLAETRVLQETFGVHLQQLTARECRAAEPMLDPAVRGGLLAPDDGSVDPRLLAVALQEAAEGAGVRLVRQRVTEICCAAGRADSVRLADDSIVQAPWIVLAAGWQSAGIAGLPPGGAPPVRPVKGQIIRLRTTATTAAAGLPAGLLQRTVRGVVRGFSVYLVPRESGELVVGATQEELGTGHDGDRGRRLGAAARRADAGARHHRARAGGHRGRPAAGHAGQRPGHRPDRAAWPGARDRAFPGWGPAGARHGRHDGCLPADRDARSELAAVRRQPVLRSRWPGG